VPGEAIFASKNAQIQFSPQRGAAPAPRQGLGGPEPRPIFQTFQFFVLSPMQN